MNVPESEYMEQQTNGQPNGFERGDKSKRQNQVIENSFDNHQLNKKMSMLLVSKHIAHQSKDFVGDILLF